MIRRAWVEVQYHAGMAWVEFSYWIRPFDMSLDRRRWRWQQPGCGLGRLSPKQREALITAAREHMARRDETSRDGES